MKNSAVKSMIKLQYNWNDEDFTVICHGFYDGCYNYEIKNKDGSRYRLTLNCLDVTPFDLYEDVTFNKE